MSTAAGNARAQVDLSPGWEFARRRVARRRLDGAGPPLGPAVDLPHCWNRDEAFRRGVAYYRGPGAYRRRFAGPAGAADPRWVWRLEAEGFYGTGEVRLNGRRLAAVDGNYLGFTLNVSGRLREGAENVLGVSLTNRCAPSVLPGHPMPDFLLYGGLTGRVRLVRLPVLHVADDVLVQCDNPMAETPAVRIGFTAVNAGVRERRFAVRWRITDDRGTPVAEGETGRLCAPAGSAAPGSLELRLPGVGRWSPETPVLYRAEGVIVEDGREGDTVARRFGVREAVFRKGRGFFLNGERVLLQGCNRHEEFPGHGRALTVAQHRDDARLIKGMGLNFVRLSHYPQHPAFLDACDALGLMVYAEIATWKRMRRGRWLANARRQMDGMIRRDRHHPAIIIWGMGNEARDRKALLALRETARAADPARPVTYAENHLYRARRERTVGIPDVWGCNYELDALDAGAAASPAGCAVLTECCNQPHARRGDRVQELMQRRMLDDMRARIAGKPHVAGFAVWSFADYATLRKRRTVRYSGLVDARRQPKAAAAFLAEPARPGRLVQRRWRRDTLREVYLRDDGTVLKRFWVRAGARRYPRPWAAEHRALTRLGGGPFPRSFGYARRPLDGGWEIVYLKEYIAGQRLSVLRTEDVCAMARVLAEAHRRGVVLDDAWAGNFLRDRDGAMRLFDFGRARVFARRTPWFYIQIGRELARFLRMTLHGDRTWWRAFRDAYDAALGAGPAGRAWIRLGFGFSRAARRLRKQSRLARLARAARSLRWGGTEMTTRRFAHGRFRVPRGDEQAAVDTFIARLDFLKLDEACRVETHNRRYRVYAFELDGLPHGAMLKVSWANPEYPAARRFNVALSQWLRDTGRRSIKGARLLRRAGLRTIRPLACWTCRPSGCKLERYFLYERLPAETSCRDLMLQARGAAEPAARRAWSAALDALADTLAVLHRRGLAHGDTALGNFLVSRGPDGPVIGVIDTDHVTRRRFVPRVLKRVADLHDLRRLRLDEADAQRFLQRYLGRAYRPFWFRVYRFWCSGAHRPLRRLRRGARRRREAA
ncbi:MAG: hypothetical protein JW951_04200 [Lentisphaerae bacterium]|nr:hypothetical protein [Lentisphaerota bacterium]